MECRWIDPPPCDAARVRALADGFDLAWPLAEILARRGVADGAGQFLQPRLNDLSPPEQLPGARAAAEVLDAAVRSGSRIVLYGDYDVDGVASLAVLHRVLARLGGRASCFLPSRAEEGYGVSEAGLARCLDEHRPEVLVAVDCGTNSRAEVADLERRGVTVAVLDHHEPAGPPAAAAAVVNPKLGSEFRYLCSAGVVFKVLHALLKLRGAREVDLREYLDLVALATVADIVPLVGENRILVRHGLARLAASRWPGLRALVRTASVGASVRSSDVGFRLGPRINAAGRLGTALESLELLLTDDDGEAARLAASLEAQNRERQAVERGVVAEAEAWVSERCDPARYSSIVAGAREWHQGVLGIVAARLMRKHNRPAVVIGFSEDGSGRGSGRSVEGFSLVDALRRCSELLDKFGGHELAAGLSIREEHFAAFRDAFEAIAREAGGAGHFQRRLGIDADVPVEALGGELLDGQELLEPFGSGNGQPVFRARGIVPASPPRVLKEKHLRFEVAGGSCRIAAIFFGGATLALPKPPWDVAFHLERNTFRGADEPQIHVVALRATQAC